MNDTDALSASLAAFVSKATGVPAKVAAETYAGPPDAPVVIVRPIREAVTDAVSGEVTGSWQIAAYGVALDLRRHVAGGGATDPDVSTVHGVGTVRSLQRATIHTSDLPGGIAVEHCQALVKGYPWHPAAVPAEGCSYEGRLAGSIVADAIAERLREYRPGGSSVTHGLAVVESADYRDGRVTVEVSVSPVRGGSLDGIDLAPLSRAAGASVVGSVVPNLGRVIDAECGPLRPQQDGRRSVGYVVPVVLTIGNRGSAAA